MLCILGYTISVISCTSQKSYNVSEAIVINDTLATSIFDGYWLFVEPKDSTLIGNCGNVTIKFQGAQMSIIANGDSVNDFRGVFKIKDSINFDYIYAPRDLKYLKERYMEHDLSFLRKYSYMLDHNGKSIFNAQCHLGPFTDLISDTKYFKKSDTILILTTSKGVRLIFYRIII